jgi:radical SAM protein with 4Fe4S-binding SPASM domain
MFYVKSELELLEAIYFHTEYEISLPYFETPGIASDTPLELVNTDITPRNGKFLLVNPQVATWCFINEREHRVCRLMGSPIQFSALEKATDPTVPPGWLEQFLTHLYRRGMLKVNGKVGIDPGMYAKGPIFRDTYLMELLLTERCNLQCEYCFAEAGSKRADMPLEIGRKAIDKLLDLPCERFILKLGGGEPFLRFGLIRELVEYVEKRIADREKPTGVLLESTTNGTVLTDEMVDFIKRYRIRFCVSLDGPKDIHDRMRPFPGGRGSYEETLKGIEKLKEHEVEFRVITVVARHNFDQARRILDHLVSLGITLVRFNPMVKTGSGRSEWDRNGIEPKEYFSFMGEVLEYLGENRCLSEDNLERMIRNLVVRTRDTNCMRSLCGAGYTHITVDPEGDLHPCALLRSSTRHIRQGNINSIESLMTCYANDPVVKEMPRRVVRNIPGCRECVWRHFCEGGCTLSALADYGTLYHPTSLCEYYRRMYPYLLDYLAEHPEVAAYLVSEAEICRY